MSHQWEEETLNPGLCMVGNSASLPDKSHVSHTVLPRLQATCTNLQLLNEDFQTTAGKAKALPAQVCQTSSTSLPCFKLNCEDSYLPTALSSLSWKKRGSTKRRNGTVMIRTKGKARDATVDFTTQSSTMQAS